MREVSVSKSSTSILPYAWVILVVVYLASVAAPLNQNKVPPVLPILMQVFRIGLTEAGMLMSVFAVTGLLLALPAGIILQRLGPKKTGLIALVCLTGGAMLGAFSTDMSWLLISRVVEGVGMGFLGVVAPASIAVWFPPDKQGAPMGIWATWVPVATVSMYALAPAVATGLGWQMVWWISVGYTLVVMLLYGWLMRVPVTEARSARLQVFSISDEVGLNLRITLANRDIWLLALEFACFNLAFTPISTFFPTFLTEVRGYSLETAARMSSISTIMMLVSAPLAGWISDRIGSRRLVLTVPFLVVSVLMFLPFRVVGWQIYVLMAGMGLLIGAVPTATFAAVPEVMKKAELAGLGLAVVMLGQNLGILIGPVLFGELVRASGWTAAGAWMVPVCLLGFSAGWQVKLR